MTLSPSWAQAQFLYETNNGTITITRYFGSDNAVTVPEKIDGLPVTSIGNDAFYYCTGLTSLTIPDGVTSIGSGAFWDCTSLTEVVLPDSLTSIGERAFYRVVRVPTSPAQ